MATGNHHKNPIIEVDRTNGRTVQFDIPPRACTIVIGGTNETYTGARVAAGNYILERSAAGGAETDYIIIPLGLFKCADAAATAIGEVVRGFLPTSVKFRYLVGTSAGASATDLTSVTADLVKATYSNGAAPTLDTNDAIAVTTAATLTKHATNMYEAEYALTLSPTPQDEVPMVEVAVVHQNLGTFSFCGASVEGTLLL